MSVRVRLARRAGPWLAAGVLTLIPRPAQAQAIPAAGVAAASPGAARQRGPATAPTGWSFGWSDRPTLRYRDRFLLEARARFQFDNRATDTPFAAGEGAGKIALKRVGVRGTLGSSVSFRIDRELVREDGWRDLFLNWRAADALEIRAGQFKLPFSLDENTSLTALDFAYRSRTSRQLAPGRDPGVMAHGVLLGQYLRYEAGWFRHDGRNARRANSTRVQGGSTGVIRLRVQPLRAGPPALGDVELGVAYAASRLQEGLDAIRGRTALDLLFFSTDDAVAGTRRRTGVEFRWQPGPFSLRSEYMRLTDSREGLDNGRGDLEPLVASGWYVSGTWAVTGESKAAGLMPARGVHEGGIGAIELGLRVEALRFDTPLIRAGRSTGNRDEATTAGVTWVANRYARVQLNVIRERLDDPTQGPQPAPPVFWSRVLRLQLAF